MVKSYEIITTEQVEKMVEQLGENGEGTARPLGKFVVLENGGYTAVDNDCGNVFVEHFNNREAMTAWLLNELEVSEAYELDKKISAEKIVYVGENCGEMTRDDVMSDIELWVGEINSFKRLNKVELELVKDKTYEMLLGRLTWQTPYTLLSEFEDEYIEEIMNTIGGE